MIRPMGFWKTAKVGPSEQQIYWRESHNVYSALEKSVNSVSRVRNYPVYVDRERESAVHHFFLVV